MNLSVNQYQPSDQDQIQSSTEDEDDGPNSNTLISPPKNAARKRGKGEEFAGGRLLRPTGRKDRHSKVSTARGPRDRRVRLSAHTAIQFYDVQDRLGCDRPSEAIEWLMKKAKAAIEALDEPPSSTSPSPTKVAVTEQEEHQAGFLTCGYGGQKNFSEDPVDGFNFFVGNNNHPNEFDSITRTQNQSFCLLLQSPCESSSFFDPQGVELGQEELFSQGGTLQSSFYVPSMSNLVCDQMPALCSSPVAGNVASGDGFSGFFRGETHNAVPNKYPRTNW